MGFGIDRTARARRKARGGLRALFGGGAKAPDPGELGARLARLARRMFSDRVLTATGTRTVLQLHPYAAAVELRVTPSGELAVTGSTLEVGPGYHVHLLAQLAPLLDELDLAWDTEPEPLAQVQDAMARHVATALAAGATAFGMPAGRTFVIPDAAVLTPLGPREAAWRDAVIAEPARSADAWPWWDAARGAEPLSRALLAQWHLAPPRAPLDDDERAVLERIAEDLAAANAPEIPTFGYRRYPLEIEVGAWTLELPGAFVTHVEDDGERWWATDGERVVELTSFTAHETQDSAALLAIAPELHPVLAREANGTRQARAETYARDGIHVTIGLVADAPHVAIATCRSHEAGLDWALAVWRSLRVSGRESVP